MFDAKSILDILMRGAQPQPTPQPQAQGGGLGGLGEILGRMMQQGAGGQQPPQGGGQGGGLGGIGEMLEQLQRQLGQAGQQQTPHASPPAGGGAGGMGGLGDILGQLQRQLGQAGQQQQQQQQPRRQPTQQEAAEDGEAEAEAEAVEATAPAGGGPAPGGSGGAGGGGLMDILGQVLGQATSGMREGAGRMDDMTGASQRAREALGQVTGKSPEEILGQIQEWIRNNPGTAAAGAGGLGAVVLGTRTGRGLVGTAAKLGALALIGGLAYKAYQNYQNGRPLISNNDPQRLLTEAAPAGTGFEPGAISNDTATLYIRSMIAAAAADGRIDADEQRRIIGGLQQAGIGAEAEAFLRQEIESPAAVEDLAGAVGSPAEAVQVYTAARLAIDPDTDEENEFLSRLAASLGVDQQLAEHIDATTRAAAA